MHTVLAVGEPSLAEAVVRLGQRRLEGTLRLVKLASLLVRVLTRERTSAGHVF